jgi:hypothetical protein
VQLLMIEDKEVANNINGKLRSCYHLLEESICEVNERCGEEQAKAYRQKVGDIFSIIVFGLLEPLYEAHPELKPSGWND